MSYEIIYTIPTKVGVNGSGQILDVPVYSLESVPEFYCARYARLAAKHLFDKGFPTAPAWMMREKCNILTSVQDNDGLVSLIEKDILMPGMIVGFFNPGTRHKNPAYPYTHLSLYLGRNGVPLFAQQIGKMTEVADIEKLKFYHFTAREILDTGHDIMK